MRKGKWAKPPFQTNGEFAASNDPSSWCSFQDAVRAYEAKGFDGIGIIIPEGFVGVDLDDSVDEGKITEQAKMIRAMLPTYCEASPSGTGIKFIAAGHLSPQLKKVCHSKSIELYDGGDTNRYFTLTGNVIEGERRITGQRESLFAIQTIISEPLTENKSIDSFEEHSEKAKELLEHISSERADHYDDWLQVGMALNWCDKSDEMLDLWMEWSSSSGKFDEAVCRNKWESFNREDGRMLTIGFLERTAVADGYKPNRYHTRAINAEDLLNKVIIRDYIVEDMLVANEPMIIGGASKSLKTSIALEMALSIATGTPFLETFGVKRRKPVMFISGESGMHTIQENLRMMADRKNLGGQDLRWLHIGFKLPKLDDLGNVEDIIQEMQAQGMDLLFIDPLYRSLRVGDSASNVYAMGAQLELIAEKIQAAGISVVLLHHFRKQGKSFAESPELEDLSQSGMAEFGRQFVLLKRREAYKWDGKHTLWFNWGGSAGHQGQRMLEVYTGVRQTGLVWQTTLRTEQEWEATQKDSKKESKDAEYADVVETLMEIIGANPGIKTNQLIEDACLPKRVVREALASLELDMEVHSEVGARGAKSWYKNRME